jgi:hypothetical protein
VRAPQRQREGPPVKREARIEGSGFFFYPLSLICPTAGMRIFARATA